ncbi:MAG: Coenzyme F420 hydrogenase/dehydrogenase, beta subunit C-terminal domain [Porphyromonas sp.]|nr:Coenzyme F420 hydrogenase/dehydrogenase, beta subunit C-terminal domain [Porphyromonas sp.]
MSENKILQILDSNLCVGCGTCTAMNPQGLRMTWDQYGFQIPQTTSGYAPKGEEKVCPFNIEPDQDVRTEDEIANIFLSDAHNYDKKIGRYINTYVGFSKKYRMTSSSGGIATYVSSQLIQMGVVDAVAMVHESEDHLNRFEFKFVSNPEDVTNGSKTKYYPVTYAEILQKIRVFPGKVAISGVGCFIKSIRLLQYYDPIFRDKIKFTIGIICGGIKSSFFSDYLAQKAGCKGDYKQPEFRVKNNNGNALDYSYSCIDTITNEKHLLRMRSVGDMWGTGFFKANACDFCDDVTTELADISLGDAWLPEYQNDDRGQNVIVVRSEIAEQIIRTGLTSDELNVKELSLDRFLRSQRGSFNHRHKGLKFRINNATRKGLSIPPKRHDNATINLLFKNVQRKRLQTKSKSLSIWKATRNADIFDRKSKKYLIALKISTEMYHIDRLVPQLIRKGKTMISRFKKHTFHG